MLSHSPGACPCCSGKEFDSCCGKYINGLSNPDTAELLMRSRYSAYTLKNEAYLLNSWHESIRPESLDLSNDTTVWMGLKIISSSENTVSFAVYFTQDTLNNKKVYALTELSNFINEDKWYYVNGAEVNTVQLTKNMPCPCQSGKKYKRCCEKKISHSH